MYSALVLALFSEWRSRIADVVPFCSSNKIVDKLSQHSSNFLSGNDNATSLDCSNSPNNTFLHLAENVDAHV